MMMLKTLKIEEKNVPLIQFERPSVSGVVIQLLYH